MSGRIPDGPLVTFEDIVRALRTLQVGSGAVVYVHSSLSRMGYVQGGADTVIDAFLQVVGHEGTVCVPTIVYAGQGPRPPFDVIRSPSEVGRITETLRLRPEACRSDNPTHSVAAIGRQADEITAGHAGGEGRPSPWGELAFGHESPWQRFYDLDAICVLLGVDWEVNTMFHYIQSRFIEPYWSEFAKAPPYPYFDRAPMGRELEGAGIVRTCALGSATVTAVSSRPMVNRSIEALHRDPARFFADGEQADYVRWYRGIPERRRRLRAGAARLPITVPPEVTGNAHVLEALHVRALALRLEETTAAIVVCDLRRLDWDWVDEARRLVEERTGIPAGQVMIACTHNHAGPDIDERLRSHVVERIAEAVDAARGRMREARSGAASATLDGTARNRRLLCGDGTVLTLRREVPSSWLPLRGVEFEDGPVDRDLTVLRIEDLDGEPIALLTAVGCHNDTRGSHPPAGVSGDFLGHAMLTLERLHPGCTALIAFGAGGDVDFDFLPHLNRTRARGGHLFQRFGRLLGSQIATAAECADMDDGGCLETRSERVRLPVRAESSHTDQEAAEVQAIRIGDLAVIGVPGELFAQTALDVRADHPRERAIIAGLANGDLGYLPPPAAYAQGGYEVEPHARSRFDQRAEPMVRQAIARSLTAVSGT
ncbi:MAG: AAC(3) family N-acetyltransferase [Spirochaetaceae bacterium]|nr:AAC(3) family N-acetyltransferase [Spirochaetaceae bacterium]